MTREAVHSLIVAVSLLTTIILLIEIQTLDGRSFWLTLSGAAITNTVVTHYIISGRQPRSLPKHRKGMRT